LYQLSGMAFSSRTNFVCCILHLPYSALRDQPSAYSFSRRRVAGDRASLLDVPAKLTALLQQD
jgi:hypothetical protein